MNRNRRHFLRASLACTAAVRFTSVAVAAPAPLPRIAWTADGNYYDKDDWGSATMAMRLLAGAGQQYRLVHFDFNSHIPQSSSTWEGQMQTSVLDSRGRYGYYSSVFFNAKPRSDAAVANLRSCIMLSTTSTAGGAPGPLNLCLAGPPDILWQALQGVSMSQRRNVRVISHSSAYNESTGGVHTLAECQGVTVVKIPNQNQRLNTKQNWSPWAFLNNSSRPENQWVYNRMRASGRADVSDSGMMYYLLYGNSTPTVADYRAKLS
jgi:hypothetical protein